MPSIPCVPHEAESVPSAKTQQGALDLDLFYRNVKTGKNQKKSSFKRIENRREI